MFPLVIGYTALGLIAERTGRPWFSRPLYFGGAALFVVVLELFALDGRAFAHLGVSLAPWQSAGVSDPRLLDTIIAMTFIALHRDWFERPAWAVAVIAAGLVALGVGFALDRAQK